MKRQYLVFASVALLTATGAVSAAESSADLTARAAIITGKLIGLSPEGATLWASHAVAGRDYGEFKRSSQLQQAMGQQLALDRPSHKVLKRLAREMVAEEARLAKAEQERLLRTAFLLSDNDRKALGRFMVRTGVEDERRSKPVLRTLP